MIAKGGCSWPTYPDKLAFASRRLFWLISLVDMETHQPGDIRNFAIVGHASSGKTMLTEAMLHCSGKLGRMGRIAEGSTASDYHTSEKQRQISIQSSILFTEWMGKKFNIIDTPGYSDFVGETLGALRVADFALVVVHAQHGVLIG